MTQSKNRERPVAPFAIGDGLFLQKPYKGKPVATYVTVERIILTKSGWLVEVRVCTQRGPGELLQMSGTESWGIGHDMPDDWSVSAVLHARAR